MNAVLGAVAVIINTLILGLVVRRLLGISVGWPRTLVVAGLLYWLSDAGLRAYFDGDGHPTVEQLTPTQILVLGLMVSGWVVALGLVVLTVLEAIVPTGSLPNPFAWVRALPAGRRRVSRSGRIIAIATKHGLGGFLSRRPGRRTTTDPSRLATALRDALQEGGATFVKLGQMLASRPDLIGSTMAAELATLHADVPPEPAERIRQVLEEELGVPVDDVFREVDPMPLAAASVGQVHGAVLRDGTPVVVKIQRPDARAQTEADLDLIARLSQWLESHTDWGAKLGLSDLVTGFAASLHEELDYRVEAENATAVRALIDDPLVRVPEVHTRLCTQRMLVMERVSGTPLSSAQDRLYSMTPEERRTLAEALLGTVFCQVLETGVFHADLHAGNLLLTDEGHLAMLDLGAVGRLDRRSREALARLLYAVDADDATSAVSAMLGLLGRPDALDTVRLERDLGQLLVRFRSPGVRGSALFPLLLSTVVSHGFSVPPQVAGVFRTMGAFEGTLAILDPSLGLVDGARDAGGTMLRRQLQPEAIRDTAIREFARLVPVLQELPRRVDDLAVQLQRGELSLRVRALSHPDDRRFIARTANTIAIALLASTCLLAGIGLLLVPGGPPVATGIGLFPVLASTLLLIAVVLGTRVLVSVFRQDTLAQALDGP